MRGDGEVDQRGQRGEGEVEIWEAGTVGNTGAGVECIAVGGRGDDVIGLGFNETVLEWHRHSGFSEVGPY